MDLLTVNAPLDSATSDVAVVTRLYREIAPLLFNWLRRGLKGDAGLAEELLQETFLRLWTHRAAIRASTDGQRRAWLFRVASRLIVDHVRRQKALGGVPLQAGACADFERLAIATPACTRAPWLTPARPAEQPEQLTLTRETLREAVAAAGPVGMQLILAAEGSQSLQEVARANSIQPGGAKMYLSRRRGDARRDRDMRRAAEGHLPSAPQRQRLAELTTGRLKRRCQRCQGVGFTVEVTGARSQIWGDFKFERQLPCQLCNGSGFLLVPKFSTAARQEQEAGTSGRDKRQGQAESEAREA